MRSPFSSSVRAAIVGAALVVSSEMAFATSQRTFVSTSGVDNVGCSITAPCRSFDAAVNATSAGGEVIVLDSGGYGATTITQSVSIIAPSGIYAGISSFSGSGININAPGAIVVLRGLSINAQGGTTGISIQNVAKVEIENCVINGFSYYGISFTPFGQSHVLVTDTTLRNNAGGGIVALPHPGGEVSTLDVSRSIIQANGQGVAIKDIARASIVDTLVADGGVNGIDVHSTVQSSTNPSVAIDRTQIVGNMLRGLYVWGTGSVFTVVDVSQSVISNNQQDGVHAGGQGYVRLSGNQLTGNFDAGAAAVGSGVIASMQDNLNAGNGSASTLPTPITPY